MDKSDACSLSSLSSESDLSLALERELGEPADIDELPAFEIRAYSPHGRTPSPIDNDSLSGADTETQTPKQQQRSPCHQDNSEYVALHEINAQISPPTESTDDSIAGISRSSSLETIFEGVLLRTPSRESPLNNNACGSASRCTPKRNRTNLLELVAINRLQCGKENQSPKSQGEFT